MSSSPDNIDWTAKSGVWTVHSEADKRPQLRGFAHTRDEALALMARLQGEDADASTTEYWVYEISKGALQDFRDFNMLPPGF
jgi:hypothetical protein